MYYAAFLILIALVVFILTPNFKKTEHLPSPSRFEYILREVRYKLGMPKSGGTGAGTRNSHKDKKADNSNHPQ